MDQIKNAKAYTLLFEELSLDRLNGIEAFVSNDIHFKDPFNDLNGIKQFHTLLVKTLREVKDPKFNVTHKAWSGETFFLRWSFNGKVKLLGHWNIEGMSEIRFDSNGLVNEHIDYWDASENFYGKLLFIGTILRFIRRRLKVL
jgi:steroid delta-isomerase